MSVTREELAQAKQTASGLPELLVEARRVSATVLAGWHGRRTSGRGEAFWQFRPFVPGEAAAAIDWRRSARDDHLYVREKEWEAVHTVWLWQDQSASMDFRSSLAPVSKRHRATVLTLTMADILSAAGERIGLIGGGDPILSRDAAERVASRFPIAARNAPTPAPTGLRQRSDVILIGDFLDPIDEIEATLDGFVQAGLSCHLIQVTDPSEETFPYAGRTEFRDPETGERHLVSRAEQYRTDYTAELEALRGHLRQICRRLDWTFLVHHTDRPATEPILSLYTRFADRAAGLAA